MITQERVKELLSYDPETGVFHWRVRRGNRKSGGKAGALHRLGYIYIFVDGKLRSASTLAWLYVYGEFVQRLDHKNNCKSDNRIVNLRKATRSQNCANKRPRPDNESGYRGVYRGRTPGTWQAQIRVRGKLLHLGTCASKAEAAALYKAAAAEHFGEFAYSA